MLRIQRFRILSTVDPSNDNGDIAVGTNYLIVKDYFLKKGHNYPGIENPPSPQNNEEFQNKIKILGMKLIFDIFSMKIPDKVKYTEIKFHFREVNFQKVS